MAKDEAAGGAVPRTGFAMLQEVASRLQHEAAARAVAGAQHGSRDPGPAALPTSSQATCGADDGSGVRNTSLSPDDALRRLVSIEKRQKSTVALASYRTTVAGEPAPPKTRTGLVPPPGEQGAEHGRPGLPPLESVQRRHGAATAVCVEPVQYTFMAWCRATLFRALGWVAILERLFPKALRVHWNQERVAPDDDMSSEQLRAALRDTEEEVQKHRQALAKAEQRAFALRKRLRGDTPGGQEQDDRCTAAGKGETPENADLKRSASFVHNWVEEVLRNSGPSHPGCGLSHSMLPVLEGEKLESERMSTWECRSESRQEAGAIEVSSQHSSSTVGGGIAQRTLRHVKPGREAAPQVLPDADSESISLCSEEIDFSQMEYTSKAKAFLRLASNCTCGSIHSDGRLSLQFSRSASAHRPQTGPDSSLTGAASATAIHGVVSLERVASFGSCATVKSMCSAETEEWMDRLDAHTDSSSSSPETHTDGQSVFQNRGRVLQRKGVRQKS